MYATATARNRDPLLHSMFGPMTSDGYDYHMLRRLPTSAESIFVPALYATQEGWLRHWTWRNGNSSGTTRRAFDAGVPAF